MNIETTNFENFTADEYRDNLLRLGAVSHSSFVGKTVYYVKPQYGVHKVVKIKPSSYLIWMVKSFGQIHSGFRIVANGLQVITVPNKY